MAEQSAQQIERDETARADDLVTFATASAITGYSPVTFRDPRFRKRLGLTLYEITATGAKRLSRAQLKQLVWSRTNGRRLTF